MAKTGLLFEFDEPAGWSRFREGDRYVFHGPNREELIAFVMKLAGAKQGDAPSAEPIPYPEYFSRLYKLATGWLLWSPDQAWAASPNEIVAAFHGRMDQLKAVHGSGEKEPDSGTTTDISSVKDRLNAIGDSRVHSMAEVP